MGRTFDPFLFYQIYNIKSMFNISKYVQLNDFVLLEYEFNKQDEKKKVQKLDSRVFSTTHGGLQYIDFASKASTNNTFGFTSIPTDASKSTWCFLNSVTDLKSHVESNVKILDGLYKFDKIKLHIVSGYHFQDCDGFLFRANMLNADKELVSLCNFSWSKYTIDQFGKQMFFNEKGITIGSKRYDKYIQLEIPSAYDLGTDANKNKDGFLANILNIAPLTDINIEFGTIPYGMLVKRSGYLLQDNIKVSLPVLSISDNFNCFMTESNNGDYIEYYATWNNVIIGKYINDIESGILPLFTSNNPNDNFAEFEETWGDVSRKWIIVHDIEVVEHIGLDKSLVTQKLSITQDSNFDFANYYRPVVINADTVNSVTLIYTCKLQNRMDGSQIVRKSSFSLSNPRKYARSMRRLNVDNMISYKVNNVIEQTNVSQIVGQKDIVKYVKVYYDTTKVVLDDLDDSFEQGKGMIYLKDGENLIRMAFSRYNHDNVKQNVDLSGLFKYVLSFKSKDAAVNINMTNSPNVNLVLGQLEFRIPEDVTEQLINSDSNVYTVKVVNMDGSSSILYQGEFLPYSKKNK